MSIRQVDIGVVAVPHETMNNLINTVKHLSRSACHLHSEVERGQTETVLTVDVRAVR